MGSPVRSSGTRLHDVGNLIALRFWTRLPDPLQTALTIGEPVGDPKGNKRAAPEPNLDVKDEHAAPPRECPLLAAKTYALLILTGELPPAGDRAAVSGEQGLGGGLADTTVMKNLAQRSKELRDAASRLGAHATTAEGVHGEPPRAHSQSQGKGRALGRQSVRPCARQRMQGWAAAMLISEPLKMIQRSRIPTTVLQAPDRFQLPRYKPAVVGGTYDKFLSYYKQTPNSRGNDG
ncbi:hypothetical protein B0H12DRAFT_1072443 [Mycena haematopus]|nr:hypothetical protein B0H12DRAFT_1072443 [Mycena haematopus]